jgi:hypothetical protein
MIQTLPRGAHSPRYMPYPPILSSRSDQRDGLEQLLLLTVSSLDWRFLDWYSEQNRIGPFLGGRTYSMPFFRFEPVGEAFGSATVSVEEGIAPPNFDVYVPMPPVKEWKGRARVLAVRKGTSSLQEPTNR